MAQTMRTAPIVACRECERPFTPMKPWWHTCSSCFRPARRPVAVVRPTLLADQLSLAETVEWAAATSANVVALRSRRPR